MRPSLYIHVPFCASRCSYCDFHTSALSPAERDGAALAWLRAVSAHAERLQDPSGEGGFRTVYIGGGTPSWLPRGILARALTLAGGLATRSGGRPEEWTVEANPEDVDEDFLSILEDAGVDRLSVGVQSLEDGARASAGRRGSALEIRSRLEALAARWKGRWSADLMAGLPGQCASGLADDARYLTGLGAGHVSLYELTLEAGTPLALAAGAGRVRLPDGDERADLLDAASEALAGAGLERYEVSNWALPGQESLHNGVYWAMGDWHALGPGASGNLGRPGGAYLRTVNATGEAYLERPWEPASETLVSGLDAAFETLMTALRTRRGLSLSDFGRRHGVGALELFGPLHERYPEALVLEGDRLRPTERGLDTLNAVLVGALEAAERRRESSPLA